ncbi:hypothetical protein GJ496_001244 [Pomphorhynchus laevis]|nr:hypothetical protein GJ496_001244 [Pomphorhynchus laevis]
MRKQNLLTIIFLACLLLSFITFMLINNLGKPIVRGFYCNDQTITKPYRESTIKTSVNILIGILFFLITFFAAEGYRLQSNRELITIREIVKVGKYTIYVRTWIIDWCLVIFWLCFGWLIECIIADTIKITVGVLRPHFHDVCNTVIINDQINCSINTSMYVQPDQYVCNSSYSMDLQYEMRKSFVSNHAGVIAYLTGFATMLLFFRWPWKAKRYICMIPVVIACLAIVIGVGVSRIIDNKHHPMDVFSGAMLGFTVAFIFVIPVRKSRLKSTEAVTDYSTYT